MTGLVAALAYHAAELRARSVFHREAAPARYLLPDDFVYVTYTPKPFVPFKPQATRGVPRIKGKYRKRQPHG